MALRMSGAAETITFRGHPKIRGVEFWTCPYDFKFIGRGFSIITTHILIAPASTSFYVEKTDELFIIAINLPMDSHRI
jgi:hypothetical protein